MQTKNRIEKAKALIDRQEKQYKELLNKNSNYARYMLLQEDINTLNESISKLVTDRDKSIIECKAREAVNLEKQIAEKERERQLVKNLMSGINPYTALTEEDKRQYSTALNADIEASFMAEIRNDINASLKALDSDLDELYAIASMFNSFKGVLEAMQERPCNLYYLDTGEITRMKTQLQKIENNLSL